MHTITHLTIGPYVQCLSPLFTHTWSSPPDPLFPVSRWKRSCLTIISWGRGWSGVEQRSKRINHLRSCRLRNGHQTYLSCRKTVVPPKRPPSPCRWPGLWAATCTCQSPEAPYLERVEDGRTFVNIWHFDNCLFSSSETGINDHDIRETQSGADCCAVIRLLRVSEGTS